MNPNPANVEVRVKHMLNQVAALEVMVATLAHALESARIELAKLAEVHGVESPAREPTEPLFGEPPE